MRSVICVQVKNEHRYIREWIEYNLDIGFDCIYIYEDWGSESHKELLQDFIDKKQVVVTPLKNNKLGIHQNGYIYGSSTQCELFKYFLDACKKGDIEADWIGFFDVDEFLTFDKGYNLSKIEEEFAEFGGVKPCWILYNANGHIKSPKGNVIDNYTTHLPLTMTLEGAPWACKSFVNVSKVGELITNHTFENCVFTNYPLDKWDGDTCYSKCHLRHYFTKSWEDFCERMQRKGNMKNNSRCYDQFFKCNPEMEDLQKSLLEELRWNTRNIDTMWISHKQKIISGGNTSTLNKIREKYRC